MKQGRLIVLSGPSGVGKGTILREVMQRRRELCYSVSATTRPIRPGEVEGKSYYFIDREAFERMIACDELLEYATYAGNYYGTPVKAVEDALANGKSVVLEIEVQGALQIMQSRPDALTIFVAPPSFSSLQERLQRRGDTAPAIAAKRLKIALEECRLSAHYQYIIVNDTVTHAAQELEAILTAEACRTEFRKISLKEDV